MFSMKNSNKNLEIGKSSDLAHPYVTFLKTVKIIFEENV
jgi:hypothetical protein